MDTNYNEIIRLTRKACWTWTEDYVLEYLCRLAAGSRILVESGTYMGASAYAMMLAAPKDAHMWCIDKFPVAGTEHVSRRNLAPWISPGRLEIIVGDSERGGDMLQHVTGKVDLIFVDDGHAEEDVMRDIRCLKPLLKPGGIMIGHDFEVPHNDVARGVIRSGISHYVPIPRLWRYDQP